MQLAVDNLTKVYNHKPLANCCGGLFGSGYAKIALDNVSFAAEKGECIGIIGKNGSGKSTLLKIICGITSPTSGIVRTNGEISALLELGAGFNPEYNGIDNIYLNEAIKGHSRKEADSLIPRICEFAQIGDYIYRPVKTYSDGMFLRLAFACATAERPDILIIDEALAVGDFAFRQKCFKRIQDMSDMGTCVLMVSHDIDTIRRFCKRIIWLNDGKIVADGDTETVSSSYMESMTGNSESYSVTTDLSEKNDDSKRFGSAVGLIKDFSVPKCQKTGGTYEFTCSLTVPEDIPKESLSLSVSFKNIYGLDLTVISTADEEIIFKEHGNIVIKGKYVCNLCAGEYSVAVSLDDRSSVPITYYDYIKNAEKVRVVSDIEHFGTFYTKTDFEIKNI